MAKRVLKKTKKIKIKLNADLSTHKAGVELDIKTDENGIPLEKYWRRRFRDAKIDNCIEIKKTKKKNTSK